MRREGASGVDRARTKEGQSVKDHGEDEPDEEDTESPSELGGRDEDWDGAGVGHGEDSWRACGRGY